MLRESAFQWIPNNVRFNKYECWPVPEQEYSWPLICRCEDSRPFISTALFQSARRNGPKKLVHKCLFHNTLVNCSLHFWKASNVKTFFSENERRRSKNERRGKYTVQDGRLHWRHRSILTGIS